MKRIHNPLAAVIRSVVLAGAGAMAFNQGAVASPQGGQVTSGSGSISNPDSNTTVVQQNSNNMVVDWQSFNVDADEMVQFIQPNSQAAVLNNIHDQNASQILGVIEANGRVFLSNPNGVIFGANSVVDVQSLVVTNHRISAEDFAKGKVTMTDVDGQGVIVNHGLLKAASGGSVTLVGDRVENHGVIRAQKGQVNLASGKTATLDFDGDGLLKFSLEGEQDQNADGGESAVVNTGLIEAKDGSVYLTAKAAKDVFAKVVNNTGVIRATGIETNGGVIRLTGFGGDVYNSGELNASSDSGKGGQVDVLGDRVALVDGASIDASGKTGGGSVRIGGDYQGKNADIHNASDTHIAKGVNITADAIEQGDGGRIIVWADDSTYFGGDISAKGGQQSGDGGFAEVSGKENLAFRGMADLSAENGKGGKLLLDPKNITINPGGAGSLPAPVGPGNGTSTLPFSDTPAVNSTIGANTITALTNGGTAVVLQANNDIVVNGAISSSNAGSGGDITMQAGRSIDINADINTDGGNLTLTANDAGAVSDRDGGSGGIDLGANITLGSGNLTLTIDSHVSDAPGDAGFINQTAGIINLSGTTVINAGSQNALLAVGNNAFGGSVQINSANDVSIRSGGNIALEGTVSGFLTVVAISGSITDSAELSVVSNSSFDVDAGQTINLDTLEADGNVILNAGGPGSNVTISNDAALALEGNVGGNLIVTTSGGVTDSANIVVGGNATFNLGASNLTLDGVGTNLNAIRIINGGAVQIDELNTIDFSIGDSDMVILNLTAGGAVTQTNSLDVSGATTVTATGFDVTLNNSGNQFNSIGVAGQNVAIRDSNSVDLAASNVTGTYSVTANGHIGNTGVLDIDGAVTITQNAANSDVILSGAINDFASAITFAGTTANIRDLRIRNFNAGAAVPTLAGLTNLSNLTLHYDNAAIALPALNIGGNLVVVASSGITDSGTVTVAGTSSFTTTQADADIDLGTLASTGSVELNTSGTSGDVTIVNASALDLAASTVNGNLSATATTGNITDSGTVTVTGTSSFTTSQNDADIDLGTLASNGAVALSTSGTTGNATIVNATGLDLAASSVNGNLDVTATTGNITDSGTVTVMGTSSFTTSQNNDDINLDSLASNGAVAVNTSGASGNATIVNAGALNLAASTVSGNLSATATTGNISDSGTVAVTGTSSFTTSQADADIILGTVASTGAVAVNTNGTTGNASIVNATALDLAASTVGGVLVATATTGNITDSGTVTVAGDSVFTTSQANDDINLGTLASTGAVTLNTAGVSGDATIVNATALELTASTINGNLDVTATTGNITDSGTVTVTGTSSFTTSQNDSDIDLGTLASTGAVAANTSGTSGNATIVNATALDLAASTVNGNLDVTATTGNITDSGTVTVSGSSSFTTSQNDDDIDLGSLDSSGFVAVTTNGTSGDVTIVNASALDLAASTIDGNLTATATTGNITDSGTVTVSGASSFTTSNNNDDINLGTLASSGAVALTTIGASGDATVANAGALDLAASSVAGALTVSATGAISDSGAIVVGGLTDINNAGNSVILDEAANNFSSISVDGTSVTLVDTNAITVASSNITGAAAITAGDVVLAANTFPSLVVNSSGNVTDTGNIVVTGNATFNMISAGNITLDSASNNFNALRIVNGGAVEINELNTVDFGVGDSDMVSLNLTAGGAVTQTNSLDVSAATTITATGFDVTLNNVGNDFATIAVDGANVSLRDSNNIDLAASNVTGTFAVNAAGSIANSGALDIDGAATFTAGNGQNIILNNAGNDFASTVTFVGTLANVNVRDLSAFALAPLSLTGNLTVNSGGDISQTGALSVAGTSSFTSATNITLTTAANDFGGAVSLNGVTATITDSNAIDLGASTLTGTLTVNAGGAVTNSGNVVVTGLTDINAGGFDIALNQSGNNFSSVSLDGQNVTVVDSNGLELAASTVTGTLSVQAGSSITNTGALNVTGAATFQVNSGNDISLNNAGNTFSDALTFIGNGGNINNLVLTDSTAVELTAITLDGALTVNAGGDVTDSGNVVVAGAANIQALGSNVTLDSAGNDFSSFAAIANNASVTDSNGINILASTLGSLTVTANGNVDIAGNAFTTLTVNAGSGNITDSGNVLVSGATVMQGNSVTLNSAGNDFNTFAVTSNLVDMTDTNGIDLANVTVAGNYTLTVGGDIVSTAGSQTVGSIFDINAAGQNITLNNAANNFNVLAIDGANIAIVNSMATVLATSNISGTLDLTSGGHITQTGVLDIDGAATFSATAPNTDILLAGAFANDFASTITFAGGANIRTIALRNANAAASPVSTAGLTGLQNLTLAFDNSGISLSALTLSGDLNLVAGGNIVGTGAWVIGGHTSLSSSTPTGTITAANGANDFNTLSINAASATVTDVNALALNASSVTGNVDLTVGGALSDNGALTFGGVTNINAAGQNVTLDESGNNFNTIGLIAADVVLTDSDAIGLAASTISGGLTVNAGGAVTNTGNVTVAGNTAINAAGQSVTLSQAGNDFNSLAVTAATASVTDTNAIDLAASNISGNYDVTAGGSVSDSGTQNIGGVMSVSAAGQTVTLDEAANDFAAVDITATQATVTDANGFGIQGNVTANLTLNAAGDIDDTAALTVGGVLDVNNAANNFVLDAGTGDVNSISIDANNVTLVDASGLSLGASNISGSLNITAAGAVTNSGAVVVAGLTNIMAAGHNVSLNNAGNDFTSIAINGANVDLLDINGIDLAASNITGNLAITAAGNISDSGNVLVAGTTTANAGSADIALDEAGNDFANISLTAANAIISDVDAVNVAGALSGNLIVNAGGQVATFTTLTVAGNTDINAAGSVVNLTAAGSNFNSINIDGSNVTLFDVDGINLGASNISGSFGVTAGGAVSNSGNLVVAGGTTITATGFDISLNQAGNDFASVGVNGNNVLISDSNAIDLSASTVAGTLTVNAGGAVSDSGVLTVAGLTTVAAGSNDVILDVLSDYSAVNITGANVTVFDSNGVDLAGITATGNFLVRSRGAVTDSAAVNISGTADLQAFGPIVGASQQLHTITLDEASNSFGGTVSFNSGSAQIVATGAVVLGNSSIGSSSQAATLTVTATGDITNTGSASIGTASQSNYGSLTSSGGDITLANAGDYHKLDLSGSNITLNNSGSLSLGAINASGNLNVTSTRQIVSTSALSANASSFNAGNDINLSNASNNLGGLTLTAGGNATVVNNAAIALQASTVGGNLALTANTGGITDNGVVDVAGTVMLDDVASAGITLDTLQANGTVTLNNAGDTVINNDSALSLAGTVAGNLSATATAGGISDHGALSVSGNSVLNDVAQAGVTLDSLQADGTVTLTSAGNTVIVNDSALALQGSVTGNLDATATAGGISDSANLAITGNTTLNDIGKAGITLDTLAATGPITITNAGNTTLVNATAIALQGNIMGSLSATATSGGITDTGALSVMSTATFDDVAKAGITLDTLQADSNIVISNAGNTLIVNDAALAIEGTVDGSLSLTASAGGISDSAALSATGGLTVNDVAAAGVDLGTLTTPSLVITNAGNTNIVNSSDITVEGTVNGGLAMNASGFTISDSGDLSVSGLADFTAATITLGNATNTTNFGSLGVTGNATVQEDSDMLVVSANGDTLNLQAMGNLVAQNGTDITANNLTLVATGDIGANGNPLNFIVPTSGSLTLNAQNIYLTSNATRLASQISSASIQGSLLSVLATEALSSGLQEFLGYLLTIDESLFNEFVTIFDVEGTGIKLPEDQEEEEFVYLYQQERIVGVVKVNKRFMAMYDNWQRYGSVFTQQALKFENDKRRVKG